jgi:RNA polymerase-binding protein DksA
MLPAEGAGGLDMNSMTLTELRRELHRERNAMYQAVAGAEADLEAIAEEHEAEFEERAQEERDARLYAALDDHGKRTIDAIDAALRRMAEDRYGECASCAKSITVARLRTVPTTLLCIRCARAAERAAAARSRTERIAPVEGGMNHAPPAAPAAEEE